MNRCPPPEALLPSAELDDGVSSHVRGCAHCTGLLQAREQEAYALRGLMRITAPSAGAASFEFERIMGAVTGALDAELARDEALLRPLLSRLARIAMPKHPRLLDPIRVPVLARVRQLVTFAAAAGVVAAAIFARSAPASSRAGFPLETARLSKSAPIAVDVVDVEPARDLDAQLAAIGRGGMSLPTRGGP